LIQYCRVGGGRKLKGTRENDIQMEADEGTITRKPAGKTF
jgi:hypothetical protein